MTAKILYALLAFSVLLSACEKEDKHSPEIKWEISALPVDGDESQNVWEKGDAIGIFFAAAGEQPIPGKADYWNICHTYDGTKWNAAYIPDWNTAGNTIEVTAYFPYLSGLSDFTSYRFSVAQDQHTETGKKASNFMYGKVKLGKNQPDRPVALGLQHRLAKLNINIRYANLSGETPEVEECKVKALPGVNINLMSGELSEAQGTACEITPYRQPETRSGLLATFSLVLPPQKITAASDFLALRISGQDYKLAIDTTFEGGKAYTLNLNAVHDTITLTDLSIADWQSGSVDGAFHQTYEYRHGEAILYQQSLKVRPIPIVFTGDGFTAAHMREGGYFDQCMEQAIEAMFQVEPYKTYREYFNIYKIVAVSQEEGADNTTKGTKRNTFFDSGWGDDYGDMRCKGEDGEIVFNFVSAHCPEIVRKERTIDEVAVMVIINENRYGGLTYTYSSGRAYCMTPVVNGALTWKEDDYPGAGSNTGNWTNILVHEGGGHCFGKLGDEYYNSTGKYPFSEVKEHHFSVPFGLNLTANKNDVPWQHFIGRPDFPKVDLYEGGDGYRYGVWRPEITSCMVDNRFYYNAPSRELIVKRIKKLAGEKYNFEEFLAKDVNTELIVPRTVLTKAARQMPLLPPPVLIAE